MCSIVRLPIPIIIFRLGRTLCSAERKKWFLLLKTALVGNCREQSFNFENATLGDGTEGPPAAERVSCQVNGTLGAISA